jgi:putative phosphoribosyl transferase
MFKDRMEAAMQLVEKLGKYKNKNGIVLAVPRGGVPIGYVIAKELGLPLEVILSKKIGHPANPEFAIGSVSMHGTVINEGVKDVSMDYIHKEADRIHETLKEKFKLFMGDRKSTDLKDKTVIIVDDGIATGSTILATVDSVKKSNPKEIIVAVPVSPTTAAHKLSKLVDEFICLMIPEDFFGVGQFYEDFSQVSDEEVVTLLQEANKIKNVA